MNALLILGIFSWVFCHFSKTLLSGLRATLIGLIGEKPYKIAFSIAIFLSILCMVFGWRSSLPSQVYIPPDWGRDLNMLLMLFSFILFAGAKDTNNIHRFIRHPMMLAVVLWSLGHLLANGDSLSLTLFGSMLAWSLVMMPLMSSRDGAWHKPQKAPLKKDLLVVLKALPVYFLVMYFHQYIAGVAIVP